jgi:hypothetical protein
MGNSLCGASMSVSDHANAFSEGGSSNGHGQNYPPNWLVSIASLPLACPSGKAEVGLVTAIIPIVPLVVLMGNL